MLEKIKELIEEVMSINTDDITEDTKFKDDLRLDSLDIFQLVMALEDKYDIEIPSDDLNDIESVGDIMEYLKKMGVED